jgi:hypothetical protein
MDGKANISIVYNEACIYIDKSLKSVGICPNSIKHLLFTGGTTRIKYLREEIFNTVEEWMTRDCNVIQIDEFGAASDPVFYDPLNLLYNLPYISFMGLPDKEYTLSSENVVALGAALLARDPSLLEANDNSDEPKKPEASVAPRNLRELEIRVKRLREDFKSQIADKSKDDFKDACNDLLDYINIL